MITIDLLLPLKLTMLIHLPNLLKFLEQNVPEKLTPLFHLLTKLPFTFDASLRLREIHSIVILLKVVLRIKFLLLSVYS